MAGKSRNVPKRDPSDARFTNTLENASSMMSQNITPKTMLNTPTLSNFVSKANSIMTGLTGNLRQNTTIATGILDITLDTSGEAIPTRKIIVVDPEGAGTTDTLDAIEMNGGEPEGSVITLLGVDGNTITLTHNFTPAGTERAILCPGDTDFTFSNDDALDLVYDKINSVWILKTSGTGTSVGASFPLSYSVDDQGSKTGTVTHSLTAATAHKLQFTATGDCDITITGFGSSNADAVDFYIEVTQDSTGGWDITFNDSEVINPPTLSTTADTTSLLACHADGDGNIRIITLLNAAIGSGVTGASKALDNLVSPTLNTDINVNTKNLTGIDEATFTAAGGTTAADYSIAVNAANTRLQINVPTGKELEFLENNVAIWTMNGDTITGNNLILGNTLVINDSSADPIANGIFTQNGNDVKVMSNSIVRNFSDMLISPLAANLDVDGFILDDVGQVTFRDGHIISTTATQILNDLAATTDSFAAKFGDTSKVTTFTNNKAAFISDTANWELSTLYAPTTPADNDTFAFYDHNFKNSVGTLETWASLKFIAEDVTNGTEDSSFELAMMQTGALVNVLTWNSINTNLTLGGNTDIDMSGGDVDNVGSFSINGGATSITGNTVELALTNLLADLELRGIIIDDHTY